MADKAGHLGKNTHIAREVQGRRQVLPLRLEGVPRPLGRHARLELLAEVGRHAQRGEGLLRSKPA